MIWVKRNVILFIALWIIFHGTADAHWKIPSEKNLNWKYFESLHFKIHYPEGYEVMAIQASVYAEEMSSRMEKIFKHRLRRVVPVFIYPSHQDFSAGNIIPFEIPESTGGFTDFFRSRIVVPFDGNYADFRHVLSHEIVHAYQFDLPGSSPGQIPLFVAEGSAEYLSRGWDAESERYARDIVVNDLIPSFRRGFNPEMDPYRAGHLLMYFISEKWGEERIGHFYRETASGRSVESAIESSFSLTWAQFDIEFDIFLRTKFSEFIHDDAVLGDARIRESTFRYEDRRGFHMKPVLSPDGKYTAFITVDKAFPVIVMRPVPGRGVTKEKLREERIVIRALRDSNYEEVQPLTTNLSFSPDGKTLLVAGRRRGSQSLLMIDVKKKRVKNHFDLPFDGMHHPSFSPDGKKIVFTGISFGMADIYIFDIEGNLITRYTRDFHYESDAVFSRDGRYIYYSSGNKENPDVVDRKDRHIYRIHLETGKNERITYLSGISRNPMPSFDGSLLFTGNLNGMDVVYRIKDPGKKIKDPGELLAVSATSSSYEDVSLGITGSSHKKENLVFTEMEESAMEVRILSSDAEPNSDGIISPHPESSWILKRKESRPLPVTYPAADEFMNSSPDFKFSNEYYRPFLSVEGYPFVFITATRDSTGTGIGAFAYVSLADETGDHRLTSLLSWTPAGSQGRSIDSNRSNPYETLNFSVLYKFSKYRMNYLAGLYRQKGVSAIFNFIDFNANDLLFNPYYRIIEQDSFGGFAGLEYPFHKYSAFSATVNQGYEEKTFFGELPGERHQADYSEPFTSLSLMYRYDNALQSVYGPLDGNIFSLAYTIPASPGGPERDLKTAVLNYSFYHLFGNYSNIAFRFMGGSAWGRNAVDHPFRIGGYGTVRGYDFQEFEGQYAFFSNLEYRFTFIENIRFGFPGSWSSGTIRGVFFMDAGSAFDDPKSYVGLNENRTTRDLNMSIGLGMHFLNFLWFIFPGAIMKIEWASPYDLQKSLPITKWQGLLSVGFNF